MVFTNDSEVVHVSRGSINTDPALEGQSYITFRQMVKKFIIPVPRFMDGGEPLVYPIGHEKSGSPIVDWKGDPIGQEGIVFMNGVDSSVQAAPSDGRSVIIVNNVTEEFLTIFSDIFSRYGTSIHNFSFAQFKSLIGEIYTYGAIDMYNSDVDYVSNAGMEAIHTFDTNLGLFMFSKKRVFGCMVKAAFGEFDGPTVQRFRDNAIIVWDDEEGTEMRLIQSSTFENTYMNENGTRINLNDVPVQEVANNMHK